VSSAIAIAFAVPLSLGIALFITELASKRLRMFVTYVIDLLAAIPSVVYGFWALAVFTKPVQTVYTDIADTLGKLPVLSRLFGGPASGASFMTAGVILAVMIIPIITSLSREVLLTVAQDDKNAALAMGATRWEMLRVAVFPRVRSGLVGAVMLGLGRAMGETIAVALVIGSSPQITSHLFRPGDSMTSVIVHNFPEATGVPRAALIGMGVVLFAITILVNTVARFITGRTTRSMGAAR
jgi:phosphate transport system permease protein